MHAFSMRFLAQFKLSKNSSYPIGSMLNFEEISVLIRIYGNRSRVQGSTFPAKSGIKNARFPK